MSALVILIGGIICLALGYFTYSAWLEKEWGVDNSRPTPAHTMRDGVDYVPAKIPVLFGHHFSSIAGAGPINGPIQAAVFGWLPCLLWILVGGIFFGAVHDYGALFASIRHKGATIGQIIARNIGERAKKLFIVFAYFTLLLLIAAFSSIVAGTFAGISPTGELNQSNGSTATISILFILLAIAFGYFVNCRGVSIVTGTVVGVTGMALCIVLGLAFPIYLQGSTWLYLIGLYIFIASVTPVWILLQPRDYLSSFLLYAMMAAALIGVIGCNPALELPAYVGFEVNGQYLFPILFVTIACGAISGFHSLIASGTTSKQLTCEKDARVIGYGGMLVESVLAIFSLIAVSYIYSKAGPDAFKMPPTKVFAEGIAQMLGSVGLSSPEAQKTAFGLMILAVSAFCLTSLDTATRLARYVFIEFWLREGETAQTVTGYRRILCNKYVATTIAVVLGISFGMTGWSKVWPLFGAANQLLAGLALLAVTAWLKNAARNHRMLVLPMAFMLIVTLCSLCITFYSKMRILLDGAGDIYGASIQAILAAVLFVLTLFLVREALPVLRTGFRK